MVGTTVGAGVTLSAGATLTAGTNPFYNYGLVISNGDTVLAAPSGLTQGSIVNGGTVTGTLVAVYLASGDSLVNQAAGLIGTAAGHGAAAVGVSGASGVTIANAGSISGPGKYAVYLKSGGSVGNVGGISGGLNGVVIAAGGGSGVVLPTGGYLLNNAGGLVTAGSNGVVATGTTATIVNLGSIGSGTAAASGHGVLLVGGGSVTNEGTGAISAYTGVYATGPASVTNNAAIQAGNDAVYLKAGGTVTNNLGGTINGALDGVVITLGVGRVINQSSITGGALGVQLLAQGYFANLPGGVVSGGGTGVVGAGAAITVVNQGSLAGGTGTFGRGVLLGGGGSVTNQTSGAISGYFGVYVPSYAQVAAAVTNAGAITGAGKYAVFLKGAGTAVNETGGVIAGALAGVGLAGGGYLSNSAGGVISGGAAGNDYGVVGTGGTITVVNQGTISGRPGGATLGEGIRLLGGGTISNLAGGTISGNRAITATGAVNLTNAGSIAGSARAVLLGVSSTVTNSASAHISAQLIGLAFGAAGRLANQGTITSGTAVSFFADGYVTNSSGALISGLIGVVIGGNVTAINQGSIAGGAVSGAYGVELGDGVLTNQSGGVISGYFGVSAASGLTVTNAGTITGIADAVRFQPGGANRLIALPGAVFNGVVDGGNTVGASAASTLELASGASTGTITGISSVGTILGVTPQFKDFANISIDPGASWSLTGNNALDSGVTLTDGGNMNIIGELFIEGTLFASSDVLTLGQGSAGEALVVVGSGGTLQTAGGLIVGQGGFGADLQVGAVGAVLSNTGTFIIGDGVAAASVAIQNSAAGTTSADVIVAAATGASDSSFLVSGGPGPHTQFSAGGTLFVGEAGFATMSVAQGATVTAAALDAGVSTAAGANVSVSDPGSLLTLAGAATIADDGAGVLSVLNGATFAAASLTIGSLGDSSGAVVISGAGSVIQLSGALNVGTALGTGDLTVGPSAAVHAAVVNLQGQVVLEGGLLDPTVSVINQGQTAGGFGTLAAGDIVDEGVIQAGGSKPSQKLLLVQGTVLGGGTVTKGGTSVTSSSVGLLQINAGGTMELTGPVLNAATTTFTDVLTPTGTYTVSNSVIDVSFADATGVLLLDDIGGFAGTVTASQKGDQFVVTGGTLSDLGVSNSNTLTFQDSGLNAGAGGIDQIIFGAPVSAANFSIVNGDTVQVACFAAGTRIETPDGPVPVEDLRAGDLVRTFDGRDEPVIWIGSQTIDCARHAAPERVWPVRVATGAFGPGVPARDVYLSPDHAMFVDGALIPVGRLVNGAGIARCAASEVTYYHIELNEHEIIVADGMPAESFLAADARREAMRDAPPAFRLFDASVRAGAATGWECRGAAPLILTGGGLERARQRALG
jgi:hypothetical protein